MPATCAVAECRNNSDKKENRPELIHHKFPITNHETLTKWINACKRKDNFNPKTSYVCSDHFSDESYHRDMRNELLGLPLKKKLKTNAVPSLFPNRQRKPLDEVTSRSQRAIDKQWRNERKAIVENLLLQSTPGPAPPINSTQMIPVSCKDASTQTTVSESDLVTLESKLESAWNIITARNQHICKLRRKLVKLNNQLEGVKNKLKTSDKMKRNGKTYLSAAQQKLLNGKKRVNWSKEDIVKALSVRSVSLKSYETARLSWKLPLPSPRTLRKYTRNFTCAPGILTDIIQILKAESTGVDVKQRICILSFDEMSTNAKVVLDKTNYQFVSGSKAQVVLARGICDGWKQPIYYDFDVKMTKSLLCAIIEEMERAGYPVHAVTCDLAAENRALWKELGIEVGHSYFWNPYCSNRKVHVFADVPHMLKLLRNHVLDDGVMLQDGTLINKATFQTLVEADNTEIKYCPKLCEKLIEINGPERMRVKYAAQLFSNHTATFSRRVFPYEPSIATFLKTVNDGFDVHNSRIPVDTGNPLKSALGNNLVPQLTALKNLRNLLETSRFLTKTQNLKKVMLPFQIGWMASIDSTLGLFEDLSSIYEVHYILTSRTTQDSLESFFSLIRAYGGPNTCPTLPEFKYRLKLLLLGSHIRPPQSTNTDDMFENCSWVSSKLLFNNHLTTHSNYQSFFGIQKENQLIGKSNSQINVDEQLQYLAGYVAHKLKKSRLCYGSCTSKVKGKSWVHELSRGGLQFPSEHLFSHIQLCNNIFESNVGLITGGNLKEQMILLIRNIYPQIDAIIVKEFVGVRLNIRTVFLNRRASRPRAPLRNRKKIIHVIKGKKGESRSK